MRNENWSVFEEQQRWAKIAEYIYMAVRRDAISLADYEEFRLKDIDVRDGIKFVEIKCEPEAIKTRNFYIELRNASNKRHNGQGYFYYSKADYICFIDMGECIMYWINLSYFRQWVMPLCLRWPEKDEADFGLLLPIEWLNDWGIPKEMRRIKKFDKKILEEALNKYGIDDINAVS